MLKLSNDPLSMISGFIKQHNTLFSPQAASAITPQVVTKITETGANTQISVMMDPLYGYTGSITLKYNRVDLAAALNKFGTTTKYPIVKIFGNPGESKTIYNLIAQVNAALGITLLTAGNFRDIDDATFVVPAKLGKLNVAITPNANTAPPCSLQILPGTAFYLTMLNLGYQLAAATVVRNVNPLVKASGALNWNLATVSPIATPVKNKNIQTYLEDFTNVFSTYPAASMVTPVAGASNTVNFTLTTGFKTAINTRLAAIGVPLLNAFVYNVHWSIADTAIEYFNQRIKYTAELTDPRVNKSFNSVFIMEAAYQTAASGWATDEYYLHYNR